MLQTVATHHAVRIMGVWVRRADAVISNGSLANAARAVDAERRRTQDRDRELTELGTVPRPRRMTPVSTAG